MEIYNLKGGPIFGGLTMRKEEGIFYCDIDCKLVGKAKRTLDVAGHYSRPDIFKLLINTKPQTPVKFE